MAICFRWIAQRLRAAENKLAPDNPPRWLQHDFFQASVPGPILDDGRLEHKPIAGRSDSPAFYAGNGMRDARKEKGLGPPEAFVDRLRDGLKVLVVDDDVDAADSLAALLTLTHYDTLVAYGGKQALDLATTFEPDVVFIDINMPRMDGYATARAFRQKFPARPPLLIAFTAQPEPADALAAEHAAFDVHISKPCDFEYLLHMLDEAISEHLHTRL